MRYGRVTMKTTSLVVLVLLVGSVWTAAQTETVSHNTWTSGAPIPTAVWFPATAVVKGDVYLFGGCVSGGTPTADVQIYNPATNVWTIGGQSLPTPTATAVAAVVKNVVYVIGGSSDCSGGTELNAVWAYNLKTNEWSSKAAMPTARDGAAVAVVNDIIYVIGGNNYTETFATVESYNPVTDAWTEETPLLTAKTNSSAGVFGSKAVGFTIVDADGSSTVTPATETGDNEADDVLTNVWTALAPDPTPRDAACAGAIGAKLYVAGGRGGSGSAINTNESFNLSKNAWKALAPMPLETAFGGSAVYKGRLYCFGGSNGGYGGATSNLQIYQP